MIICVNFRCLISADIGCRISLPNFRVTLKFAVLAPDGSFVSQWFCFPRLGGHLVFPRKNKFISTIPINMQAVAISPSYIDLVVMTDQFDDSVRRVRLIRMAH